MKTTLQILVAVLIYSNGYSQLGDTCNLPSDIVIKFDKQSHKLPTHSKNSLDQVYSLLVKCPHLNIDLIVSSNHNHGKVTWDRTSTIVNYLVKKGLRSERILFLYSEEMDIRIFRVRNHIE
jgi:hypothetical protein